MKSVETLALEYIRGQRINMGLLNFLFNKIKKKEQKHEINTKINQQENDDKKYEHSRIGVGQEVDNLIIKPEELINNIDIAIYEGDRNINLEKIDKVEAIEIACSILENTKKNIIVPEECMLSINIQNENVKYHENFDELRNQVEVRTTELLTNEQKWNVIKEEHRKCMEQLRLKNLIKQDIDKEQLELNKKIKIEEQLMLEEQRRKEERLRLAEQRRKEEQLRLEEQRRKEEQLRLAEQRRKEEQLRLEEQRRKEEQLRLEEQRRKEEQLRLEEQRRKEEPLRLEEQRRKQNQLSLENQKINKEKIKNEKTKFNNEIEEQIIQAKKNCIEIIYDGQKNEILIDSIDNKYIYTTVLRKLEISRNDGKTKEIQIRKETKIYEPKDFGILIFYNKDDIDNHKKLVVEDVRYKDNYNNIYKYFSSKFNSYKKEVQEDQPAGILLTPELKKKIISSYYDHDKNMQEEIAFHSQISGCFGRIDFDTEYYRENYEDYYNKKNFYDKVYISKDKYRKFKDIHIVNWRSPIASMYYDNESTTLTRKNNVDIFIDYIVDNPNNIYNHELMLKRSYNFSPFKYNNLYISGDAFYFDGSADSFLLNIINENRTDHKITDIIKSIQSNQNKMIRQEVNSNMIVQGCAGSGKTMILLHRVSYLLFNSLLPSLSKVKIITPNRAFSIFIKDLAISLELENIERITMFEYYSSLAKRYQEMYSTLQLKNIEGKIVNNIEIATNTTAIKYYNRYNEMYIEETNIEESLISSYYNDEMLNYIKNEYYKRVNTLIDKTHAEKVIKIAERFGLNKIESLINGSKQFFDYIYELCRSEILYQNGIKENELKKLTEDVKKTQHKISNKSSNINVFEELIQLEAPLEKQKNIKNILLTEYEKNLLQEVFNILQTRGFFVLKIFEDIREYFRNKNDIRSSAKIYGKHELLILLYLYFLHCGSLNSSDQFLFIDEGQDYSPQEYKLLKLINGIACKFNVFGDVNQLLNKKIGINKWDQLKDTLNADFYELNENYRNTVEITEFVNNKFNFNLSPIGIRGQDVKHINLNYLKQSIENEHKKDKEARIAFIGCKINDIKIPDYVKWYRDVKEVKGLEFDVVFVITKNMSKNEEYISLTRALHSLYIVNLENIETKLYNSESESRSTIITTGNEKKIKSNFSNELLDIYNLFENNIDSRESLVQIKKEQEKNIRKILEQREIKHLVHFTRLDNLESILKNGLVPINLQKDRRILSASNDKLRLDSHLNCTSCSIEYPNYKLLYKFSKIDFPGTDWVVLVLDTDVLFTEGNFAYFCNTNAARLIPHIFDSRELCIATAFEDMFSEMSETIDGKKKYRKDLLINDNFTTDPQAEILISDIIESKYIKNICFQNQITKNKFISNCDNTLLKKFSFSVYPEFFNARNDYMFW